MRFDSLVIDAHHGEEMLQRLIGLLIEQEVEPLQVVHVQGRRDLLDIPFAETTQRPARSREQQEQPGQQECRLSRHRKAADSAVS